MLPPGSSFRLSQLDAFVDRVDADAAQWRRDKALPDGRASRVRRAFLPGFRVGARTRPRD